jgi:hypothetical protein
MKNRQYLMEFSYLAKANNSLILQDKKFSQNYY